MPHNRNSATELKRSRDSTNDGRSVVLTFAQLRSRPHATVVIATVGERGEDRRARGRGTVRRRSESAALRGRSGFARQPDGGRGRGALLYSQGSVDWGESAAASRDDYGGENGARFARLVQQTSICW